MRGNSNSNSQEPQENQNSQSQSGSGSSQKKGGTAPKSQESGSIEALRGEKRDGLGLGLGGGLGEVQPQFGLSQEELDRIANPELPPLGGYSRNSNANNNKYGHLNDLNVRGDCNKFLSKLILGGPDGRGDPKYNLS